MQRFGSDRRKSRHGRRLLKMTLMTRLGSGVCIATVGARLVCCWCGAKLGIDLLARDRLHATHDHTVVLCQALLDYAQIPDELSLLDFALLDHTVLVDDEHIAAALVATKRNIGHEQRRLRPRGTRTRTE